MGISADELRFIDSDSGEGGEKLSLGTFFFFSFGKKYFPFLIFCIIFYILLPFHHQWDRTGLYKHHHQ